MAQPETLEPMLPLQHTGPWTEEEFLDLPEGSRVELLDGSLLLSPRGRGRHQLLAGRLFSELDDARTPEWRVLPEFDVRLRRERIFIPDIVVIAEPFDLSLKIIDADRVGLVVEIASPSTLLVDRNVKTHAYAEAGIPRLLRIEFDVDDHPVGLLHVLDGDAYRLARRSAPEEPFPLDRPFPADLDLSALAGPA